MVDINMSPVDGFEVTSQICKMKDSSSVIGLSVNNSIPIVKRFLALGAAGYLTKNSSKEELIRALIEVKNGNRYVCEEVRNALARQVLDVDSQVQLINSLSSRELEVIQNVKLGLSSREIGLLLDISMKTVEAHRHHILKKLKLNNTAVLINFFNTNGI